MDEINIDNNMNKIFENIITSNDNEAIINEVNKLIQTYYNIDDCDKINKLIKLIISNMNISDKISDNSKNITPSILQLILEESDKLKINQQNINANNSTVTITNTNQPTINVSQPTTGNNSQVS